MVDPPPTRPVEPIVRPGGRVTRYRVELPHAGIIPTDASHFEATEYARRRTGWAGLWLRVQDLFLGRVVSNVRLAEQRLSKKVALAVFSSDALSSTAYATQEILLILVLAGAGAITYSLPIAAVIVLLLGIVVISYRQIIRAYPRGGGAYTVAHENLGVVPGLVAAAALLIDYVLTVSVSIAACVEAIVAAFPATQGWSVAMAVSLVAGIALSNLRGVRESGTAFAIPTYGFVVVLGGTIAAGIVKVLVSDDANLFAVGEPDRPIAAQQSITLFLVLRAFSQGCTALTGVEAISNGVGAFRPPESKNAATTMAAMALLLGSLFLGVTLLARHFGIVYEHGDTQTVTSQIGEEVFGRNALYFTLQFFTAAILFLAANTAYAGFPLLGAILARDGYLPRIFYQRGNRLVFSWGILALTGLSVLLLVAFGASTTRLIPLYALGVFLSFTLAQASMLRHWVRTKEPGWRRARAINAFGATATAVVFVIILVTKFTGGGWMVVVALPIIALILWRIGGFYRSLERSLRVPPEAVLDIRPRGPSPIPVIVPVQRINLAAVMALGAACERSRRVTAVHVIVDPEDRSSVEERWRQQFPGVPLVVIDSPYRTVAEPIALYVNDLLRAPPHEVAVLLPLIKVEHWWHRPLVNQSVKGLASLLRGRRHVDVVPYVFHPGSPHGRRRALSGP